MIAFLRLEIILVKFKGLYFCLVFMSSLRPQIRRFVDPSVFQKSFHQLSRTLLTHLNRPSVAISIRIQTWNSYSSGILRCVQRIELVGWMRIDGRSVGIGNLVAGRTNIGTRSRGLCRPANRSHRRIQGRWGRPSLEKSRHAEDSSQTNHHGSYIVDAPLGETAITLVKSNIPVIYWSDLSV